MKKITLLALLMLYTGFCHSQNIIIQGTKIALEAVQNIEKAQENALHQATEEISKMQTSLDQINNNISIDTDSILNRYDTREGKYDDLIMSTNERRQKIKDQLSAGWRPKHFGIKRNYNINNEDPDSTRSYTILRLMDDFGSKSKSSIRRWVQFMMTDIINKDKAYFCKDANRSATQFVKIEKDYSIIKIPANTKGIPPIMFVAHTDNGSNAQRECYNAGLPIHYNYDGGSINIGNNSIVVSPLEKNIDNQINQPFTDVEARTIITTNGETPIGLDAVASSTMLVTLCAQIAFNDTLRHGDVYFCITQNKKAIRTAKGLRSLYNIMGSNNDGLMVLLDYSNSQDYEITDNTPKMIKDIVDKSYRTNGRIVTQRALETTENVDESYPPTISIYCGIKDPGTLGEWACLEYMKQSLRIACSITSMLGQK